ncbi:Type 1 glutamine amidotransferase-like domain-containing protein [Patescibacteria group bacterium]|nr:Type 1 glutamine amidotransferase-like domain-containing protein [Patescibacteria group bacterium]
MSKTKYILHGGAARRETEDNKKFFEEITKGLSDSSNVLVVCYAKPKETWSETLEAVKKTISSASPQKVLNFELASDKTSAFIEQIKKADAIYLLGGDSHTLKEYLSHVPNLSELWAGKTVAGSSAGALVLSKYFYENDDDTYNEGLSILPFKTFCHYAEEKSDKLEKLRQFGENIEVRTIPEEKFFIIEQ